MTRNATQEGVDAYLRKRKHGPTITALGIDPGIGHTGWAVILWPTRRIGEIGTVRGDISDVREVMLGLVERHWPSVVSVQVPVMRGKTPTWNPSEVSLRRHALFCGRILGAFEGFVDAKWRHDHSPPAVVAVPPKRGCGLKAPMAQWQAAWDYTGRTSQDARDAAVIAAMGCVAIGGEA